MNKLTTAVLLFALFLSFTSGANAEIQPNACQCECICQSCTATVKTSGNGPCSTLCRNACVSNPSCGAFVGVSYDGCSSGGCPATLIYGENSEEVELLRYFRDSVLAKTQKGRELIKLYYNLSPVIFETMEEDEEFKEEVKEMVDGVLGLIGETK